MCLGGNPGFDLRAANGGVDQPDRDAEFFVELATEEIERSGKAADILGRTGLPKAFAFGAGSGRVRRGLAVVADERVFRGGLLGVEVVRALHGHRHIGLARAEPNFADEDVLHFDLMSVLARNDE